jgi:hypothetical protein
LVGEPGRVCVSRFVGWGVSRGFGGPESSGGRAARRGAGSCRAPYLSRGPRG